MVAAARRDDRGFTLTETVIGVVLVGVVLASAAVGFVGFTRSAAALEQRQDAARVAASALATARTASPVAAGDGCVPLLAGRTPSAVSTQWAARPAGLDLSGTDPATTPSGCTGAAVVPLRGLATGATQVVSDPVVVGGASYAVSTFVGTCRLPLAGGPCVAAAAIGTVPAAQVFRVVVAVTWTSGHGCPGGCLYTLSTLVDGQDDPVFDTRRPQPSAPVGLAATPAESAATVSWSAPVSEGDSPVLGYRVSATPTSGGGAVSTTTGATVLTTGLTGLVDGLTYVVEVRAYNALGDGAAATVSVVPYPSTVMTAARTAWWLDASDASTLTTDAAGTTPVAGAGETVRRWKDRSPNANDATVLPGSAAPVTVTSAGRVVPLWDGATTCLRADPAKLPVGSMTSTTFVVATATDPVPATAPSRQVLSWGTHTSGAARQVYKVAGGAQVAADLASAGVAQAPLDWSRTTAQVAAAQHGPAQVTLWAAGQVGVTTSVAVATGTGAAGLGCTIWPDATVNDRWLGPVQEVVVLTGTATSAERRIMEEYLARKWSAPVTPRAPATVTVTNAGPGALAVVWEPPAWDGGSPPTGYTATASPGGAACTSTASGCVLTGLAAGTTYSVTVKAANVAGTGPASAARTGTA